MSRPLSGPRPFVPSADLLRVFASVIIASAASSLQDWSTGWPKLPIRSTHYQREALKAAWLADQWFLETDDPPGDKFSFAELAEFLGIEPEVFVERLYRGLDGHAMDALWRAAEVVPQKAKAVKGRHQLPQENQSASSIEHSSLHRHLESSEDECLFPCLPSPHQSRR